MAFHLRPMPLSMKKVLIRCTLSVSLLLALAAGCMAWWLWGWRVGGGELRFHESWAPEHCAEMQAIAHDLCGLQEQLIASKELIEASGWGVETHATYRKGKWEWVPDFTNQKAWQESLAAALFAKSYAAPLLDSLKALAADGQVATRAQEAAAVAQVACRTRHIELAKELTRRGADVNAMLSFMGEKSGSCFQTAIHGKGYVGDTCAPLAERLSLLEVMLHCGADPNAHSTDHGKFITHIGIYLSASNRNAPDHGAMLEWLLDHGLRIEDANDVEGAAMVLTCEGTLPAFKRIVQKALLPLTPENKARLLSRIAGVPCAESEQKTLWLLEELGTDPNYTIMLAENDEESGKKASKAAPSHRLPLPAEKLAHELRYFGTPRTAEDESALTYTFRLLDILFAHGARLDNPTSYTPTDPSLRTRYQSLLQKYHLIPDPSDSSM